MDSLTSARIESFAVEVLDENDRVIGRMGTVLGGRVEANADTAIRTGCSINIDPNCGWTLTNTFDVMKHRIRPWVRVNRVAWPLGVFLPSSPDDEHHEFGKTWNVKGLDKLVILQDSSIPETYSVAAGRVVTDVVRELIVDAGETRMAITPSPLLTRTDISWPPGTSHLRMINDLLGSIDYFSVWADGYGQYRVQPYTRPSDRLPVREFLEGDASIHSADYKRTRNTTDVPNRVILTTEGTDEVEGLVAVAENTDPNSPYSYQARGSRWVTRVEGGLQVADQATLDAQASRMLSGATLPITTFSVSHAIVPLNLNEVVRFKSGPYDTMVSINEYQVDLEVGSLMSGLWYEVNE